MTHLIGDLLATACQRFRDRPALVRRGETRTYGELLERGARLANALRGAGLAPGTPVAAMLEDRIAALEVYVGAFFGGYPLIHVNDRLAAPEVAHILADSGARALFHTDGRSEVVAAVDARSALRLLVTIGADRPPGAIGFEELIATARSALKITPRTAGDLAIVGYTSGTTGLPKGAMISQRALTDCVRLMPSLFRISSYGRCAFTGTLSFVSGIWGVILPHLYTGGTVTFLHPYTPESWADHIEADQSTCTYAPTPFIPAFAAEMRRRPKALRSVESVIHSGLPVPRSHVHPARRRRMRGTRPAGRAVGRGGHRGDRPRAGRGAHPGQRHRARQDPDRQLQAAAAGAFRRRAAAQREHESTQGPTARRPDPAGA